MTTTAPEAGTDVPLEKRPAPVLDIRDLEVRYGRGRRGRSALNGVSLSVEPGETVGVIGETGSGKSTLARAVLGLVRASAGSILVGGEDVTAFNARRWRSLRRRGVVQYVFQDPCAVWTRTSPSGTR